MPLGNSFIDSDALLGKAEDVIENGHLKAVSVIRNDCGSGMKTAEWSPDRVARRGTIPEDRLTEGGW